MKLEFLVEFTADLQQPTRNTGDSPFGTRGLAVVTGGRFEGKRLKGKIWGSGGDWWLRASDGAFRLDVRPTFATDDAAPTHVPSSGLVTQEPRPPLPQHTRRLAPRHHALCAPTPHRRFGPVQLSTNIPVLQTGNRRQHMLHRLHAHVANAQCGSTGYIHDMINERRYLGAVR